MPEKNLKLALCLYNIYASFACDFLEAEQRLVKKRKIKVNRNLSLNCLAKCNMWELFSSPVLCSALGDVGGNTSACFMYDKNHDEFPMKPIIQGQYGV